MDKLKLTGLNLGRVFNYRCERASVKISKYSSPKQPNLKLKTRPKPVLGSLPLAFALPVQAFSNLQARPEPTRECKTVLKKLGRDKQFETWAWDLRENRKFFGAKLSYAVLQLKFMAYTVKVCWRILFYSSISQVSTLFSLHPSYTKFISSEKPIELFFWQNVIEPHRSHFLLPWNVAWHPSRKTLSFNPLKTSLARGKDKHNQFTVGGN